MSKVLSFLQAEICNESLFHFKRNTLYRKCDLKRQMFAHAPLFSILFKRERTLNICTWVFRRGRAVSLCALVFSSGRALSLRVPGRDADTGRERHEPVNGSGANDFSPLWRE